MYWLFCHFFKLIFFYYSLNQINYLLMLLCVCVSPSCLVWYEMTPTHNDNSIRILFVSSFFESSTVFSTANSIADNCEISHLISHVNLYIHTIQLLKIAKKGCGVRNCLWEERGRVVVDENIKFTFTLLFPFIILPQSSVPSSSALSSQQMKMKMIPCCAGVGVSCAETLSWGRKLFSDSISFI